MYFQSVKIGSLEVEMGSLKVIIGSLEVKMDSLLSTRYKLTGGVMFFDSYYRSNYVDLRKKVVCNGCA